jgi:hypothetical protein
MAVRIEEMTIEHRHTDAANDLAGLIQELLSAGLSLAGSFVAHSPDGTTLYFYLCRKKEFEVVC